MASLMSLLSAVTVPTGPRVPPEWTVSDIVTPPGQLAPLGYEVVVITPVPFWESTTFLIILAAIAICLLIALIIIVCRKRSGHRDYRGVSRRMREESAYLRSGLFDAASDIVRETAKYRSAGGRGRD